MSMLEIKESQCNNAIKWIEALLSGEYKQSKSGVLGNAEMGFCCWGLGCHVVGTEFDYTRLWNWEFSHDVGFNRVSGRVHTEYRGEDMLSEINDKTKATFQDIGHMLIDTAHENFASHVAVGITKHFKSR